MRSLEDARRMPLCKLLALERELEVTWGDYADCGVNSYSLPDSDVTHIYVDLACGPGIVPSGRAGARMIVAAGRLEVRYIEACEA